MKVKKIFGLVMMACALLCAPPPSSAQVRPINRPSYDLNFKIGSYIGGAILGGTDGSRNGSLVGQAGGSGTRYYPDGDNVLRPFTSGQLAITPGRGLWIYGLRYNQALWSRDLTNAAWVKVGGTAALDQPGAELGDPANTASSFTATLAAATVLQTISVPACTFTASQSGFNLTATTGCALASSGALLQVGANLSGSGMSAQTLSSWVGTTGFPGGSGLYTASVSQTVASTTITATETVAYSAWAKCIVCTGVISMTMDGVTWTDVTSQFSAAYSRISIPVQTTTASMTVGFRLANSGDKIAIDHNLFEVSTFPTYPIPTTTARASKTGEMGVFDSGAGPISPKNGGIDIVNQGNSDGGTSFYAECVCDVPNYAPPATMIGFQNPVSTIGGVGAAFSAYLSTSPSPSTTNQGSAGLNRFAGSLLPGGRTLSLNGGPIAFSPYSNATRGVGSHATIGNRGALDLPREGVYQRIILWPGRVDPSTLTTMTASGLGF